MNRIIRIYNQNRHIIWVIIFIIVGIVLLTNSLKKEYKKSMKRSSSIIGNSTTISSNYITENKVNIPDGATHSIISQTKVSKETGEDIYLVIEKFINYCNDENIEDAYNLLSQECKENVFLNINEFQENYQSKLFKDKKIFDVQLLTSKLGRYIYSVKLKEDALSTGNLSDVYTEEYYTVISEDGEYKLNINNFIQKKDMNLEQEIGIVKVKINKRIIFRDYEKYEISIINGSYNQILLDSKNSTKTIYITGDNKINYYANMYEIYDNELLIEPGEMRNITLSFSKLYRDSDKIESMTFSDIHLNNNDEKDIIEMKF